MRHLIGIVVMVLGLASTTALSADNQSLLQLQRHFNSALVALDAAENQCDGEKQDLDLRSLEAVELTKEELNIVLSYHYLRSYTACYLPALNEFLLASAMLAAADEERAVDIQAGNTLVIYDHILLHRAEYEYLSLAAGVRKQLDEIATLHRPFHMPKLRP